MVRIKHRYLLVNILYPGDGNASHGRRGGADEELPYTVSFKGPSPDALDGRSLMRLIRDGVADLFGDYGAGVVAGSLQVKYFSPATSTAIIRVSRDHYRLVWAALTFTTVLPRPIERACVMQVVRVSGTIRKVEEEAIRQAKTAIKRARESGPKASSALLDRIATDAQSGNGPIGSELSLGTEDEDPDDGDDDDDDDVDEHPPG